ncbi:zinc finger protein 385C isoform X2 [Anarrhichthys ocellatus]|uniref:zinc finger protein 385C isoform X2 n=1 Tax=Anarrhichthys ocellatus TaxID=433405 RepID=UPI0012ECF725|nr:zinc finger protein 385C isoform X2 [Anarrhichthys ocellatus]
MKRPFSPSALPNNELDRRGFGARPGLQMDCEPCCDTQDEGLVPDEQSPGGALPSALCRPKRERKQRCYTLCEVCNIQLNSAAQALIHYNGKSHQKRVKQISNGKVPSKTGTSAQGRPLLASLPIPGRPLQPQLDLKHLLPFRLNGSSPLSLFPNFNTNQAEAHYKGHKHARKLKAMETQKNRQRRAGEASSTGRERDRDKDRERDRDSCKTSTPGAALPALMDTSSVEGASLQSDQGPANLEEKLEESPGSSVMQTPVSEVSSVELVTLSPPQISPSSHLSETASDTSAPKVPEAIEAVGPVTESGSNAEMSSIKEDPQTDEDKDPKKSKAHLHCPVCKVTVNSISQLEAHNSGTKHKLMLEGHSVLPRRRGKVVAARAGCKSKRLASKGRIRVPSKNYQCEVCEICVNSETQLSQHMNSRRHKDRLAGKPPKPKFTPHSKSQQSTSLASMRWSGYAGVAVSAMKKAFSQYNLTSLTSLSSFSSQTKLAWQKQLTKTLTAGFLPSPHFTQPTLCTMASNPLALRHPVGTTTFIQHPFLGPALFRPAPGPLRATHTPFIFSPY